MLMLYDNWLSMTDLMNGHLHGRITFCHFITLLSFSLLDSPFFFRFTYSFGGYPFTQHMAE